MSDDQSQPQQYWFNTKTGQVDVGHLKPGSTLLGPYGSREQAERALATAREKTEAWDRQDADDA